jgi:hypothetical protein
VESKKSARSSFVDAWHEHVKDDMHIETASELADEYQKSVENLKALYDASKVSVTEEAGVAISDHISDTHKYHLKHLKGVSDRLGKTAARGSFHHVGTEQQMSETAMDAGWLMEKAIERGDAASAAYLSFVHTVSVLAINEDEIAGYFEALGSLGAISSRGRKAKEKAHINQFGTAKESAIEIAEERWAEEKEAGQEISKIGNVISDIQKVYSADLDAYGLKTCPAEKTIKAWIKSGVKVPPAAIKGGRPTTNPSNS